LVIGARHGDVERLLRDERAVLLERVVVTAVLLQLEP